jgi:hypothetical protein
LNEEIYLQQPEGFIIAGQENAVCRLHKCLYGLKQASRVWNATFDTFLKKFGLRPSTADPCLYLRHHQEEFLSVAIWVDDGLVCSNNESLVKEIITYLNKHFDMRHGPANHFVGLSISRNRHERTLFVTQPDYISQRNDELWHSLWSIERWINWLLRFGLCWRSEFSKINFRINFSPQWGTSGME